MSNIGRQTRNSSKLDQGVVPKKTVPKPLLKNYKPKAKKLNLRENSAMASVNESALMNTDDLPSSSFIETGSLHQGSMQKSINDSPPDAPSIFQSSDDSRAERKILDTLREDTAGLTPENAFLAETIGKILVKAVLAATDYKLIEQRKKHDAEIAVLKTKIQTLADQRDMLENYTRRNTVVISGPALPKTTTNEDCYDIVTKLVESSGEKISRADIDICHRLPSRKTEDDKNKKPIIAKFVRRETKHRVLRACRAKKPKDIFFNESVSRTRGSILFILRKVKKEYPGKISSIKTEECNVKVFTPPLQTGGSYIGTVINTRLKLDDFLMTTFGFRSAKYIKDEDWKQ